MATFGPPGVRVWSGPDRDADLAADLHHALARMADMAVLCLWPVLFGYGLRKVQKVPHFLRLAGLVAHARPGGAMADAMILLDAAIRAVMNESLTTGTLDRIKASYPAARRDVSQLFLASDGQPEPSRQEPSRIGALSGFDGETDTLNRLLDYSSEKPGIWLNPGFVKPAIVGLAIWLDRMADPENRTTLRATLHRAPPGRSGYGVVLAELNYIAAIDTPEGRKAAHLRAQAVLVAAAWWALNSPTAQRLGFLALEAEATYHLAPSAGPHAGDLRPEIGPSPYVTITD